MPINENLNFDMGNGEVVNPAPIVDNEETTENLPNSNANNVNLSPTPKSQVNVFLTDKQTPIILLFGAGSSGKTMTLVRLAKYLRKLGYTIQPDSNFSSIWEYEKNSKNFNSMVSTAVALEGTGYNDFLLLKVCDGKGTPICQILEGAGEDYFSSTSPAGTRANLPFSPYMNAIFTSNNKKVWIFITEPNWKRTPDDKQEYVDRIRYCKNQHMGDRDKTIILYNKVDTTNFVNGTGKVVIKNAMQACNNEYPNIFEIFKKHGPLSILTGEYACEFVPFSTGSYPPSDVPGERLYNQSHDDYPKALWTTICKYL